MQNFSSLRYVPKIKKYEMESILPQSAALDKTRSHALSRQVLAREKIAHVLKMSNIAEAKFEEAVQAIRQHARVAFHFHPDRLDVLGRTVAESLLENGMYKSQFETGLSNGKLAPTVGGPRDSWENNMFGDAYGPDVSAISATKIRCFKFDAVT